MRGNARSSWTQRAAVLCVASALVGVLSSSGRAEGTATRTLLDRKGVEFAAPESREGNKPRGISGMACAKVRADGTRECLAINDEERVGEIVVVGDGTFVPQPALVVPLLRQDDDGRDIVGKVRVPACPDKRTKLSDLDGEGVAIDGSYVYVTGSHSCSGDKKYKPGNFVLARFHMASDTQIVMPRIPPAVERTWRLADALVASDAGAQFGALKDDGTNIEGIAVADGLVYAGLRTPSLDGKAAVVAAPVDALFAPGTEPLDASAVKTFRVALGEGSGIRDMAALTGNGLLILSGPTKIQEYVSYRLWRADRTKLNDPPQLLGTLPDARNDPGHPRGRGYGGTSLKAESVTVLDETPERLTLLVLYDNIDEGYPTQVEIDLAK